MIEHVQEETVLKSQSLFVDDRYSGVHYFCTKVVYLQGLWMEGGIFVPGRYMMNEG